MAAAGVVLGREEGGLLHLDAAGHRARAGGGRPPPSGRRRARCSPGRREPPPSGRRRRRPRGGAAAIAYRFPAHRPWQPRVRLGRRCSPALTPCGRPPAGPAPSPVPSSDRRRSRSRPPGEEPPLRVVLFGGDDAVVRFRARRGRNCCFPHLLCLVAAVEACRSGLQFWPHDLLLIPSLLCSGDLLRSAPSSSDQPSMEAKTTGVSRAFTSPPPTTTAPPHGRSRQHWRGMEQLSAAVVLDRRRSGSGCLLMQADCTLAD